MSCLCYNMYVIKMKNEYDYYISIIKPIEKKYNRMCILYSLIKINYFKTKKQHYNKVLIKHYRLLQKRTKNSNIFIKSLNK